MDVSRLEHIKERVAQRWGEEPRTVEYSLKILSFLETRPGEGKMLTYADIARVVGAEMISPDLERALAILSSRFGVLKMGLVYFEDDGSPYYLDDEEVRDFLSKGEFADPESGEELDDANQKLFPYYKGMVDAAGGASR